MDSEVVYSIFGILGLAVVAYKTLNAGQAQTLGKTQKERKEEAISRYKVSLAKSLKGLSKDDDMRKSKKIMILREYSEELTFNILFDEEDKKEIIAALAGE